MKTATYRPYLITWYKEGVKCEMELSPARGIRKQSSNIKRIHDILLKKITTNIQQNVKINISLLDFILLLYDYIQADFYIYELNSIVLYI